jgi:ComF family protein
VIPFVYTGPLVKAIQNLKYRKKTALARPLSSLLIRSAPLPPVDLVVPIPLHPSRLRKREFNQAALLAKPLSKHLGRPFLIDTLRRLLPTAQQVGLTREERARNVRGAFAVRNPDRIKGAKILLVDDVLTTGATFNAAARALKKGGAKEVIACALARMV